MYLPIAIYAWLLANLPEVFARVNAWIFGQCIWLLRRKIVLNNLQQAFPDGDYSEFHKRGDLIKTQTGFFWFMSLYMQKATFARPVAKILKKSLIFLETSFE